MTNENSKPACGRHALTIGLITVMVLTLLISTMTESVWAAGFSGKVGSKYTVTSGGQITYGSGEGGYSNSRKCDLGDDLGSRYSYCVQPAKPSPGTGTVTVDKVLTEDDDQGKWNALRNIVYYSPSYPGYDQNVKNIRGTHYTGNFSKDWGIAHLALSYVYAGRPSDMATYGGTHASDLGEVWTKAKALGNALWSHDSVKDDAVPDSFKVFICYMSGVQDMLVGYMEAPGYLTMKKSSEIPKITNGNGCYSLEGAVFTVYDSSNKEAGKLTVKADGTSNTLELFEGKYTVKETKAPKGYALDKSTVNVKIESEETTTFSAKDTPITNIVNLLLTKKPKGYPHDHGEGDATLAGAVYKFCYYDGHYSSASAAEASGNPTATWYFTTDANGKINGTNPTKASGYTSSDLYKDADGKIAFPLGTYVIQEAKAPTGYLLNTDKVLVDVTEDGSDNAHVKTYNEKASNDDVIIRGGVKVSKIDNDLDEAYAQGDASLAGAEFTIYNKSKETVMVGGKEIAKDAAAALVITTDASGIATSASNALPYGTYLIKETKPSTGYLLNTQWSKTFSIREEGKIIDLTADKVREAVERGGVQIVKRDKEIAKSEALGGATLKDIVFTIKNVSAHDVVVRKDIGSTTDKVDWKKLESKKALFEAGTIKRVKPNEDVGKIITHWNEEKKAYTAETLADDLPYGTYTIRETKTNNSYQRTDKTEHRFEVRKNGTVYAYDNGLEDVLTFDDYVYRSDIQGTKIGDGDSKRLQYVPFKITSVTNGETHVIVADNNGFFSTKDRRTQDELEEEEGADTARKQNPFDDLLTAKEIKKVDLQKRESEMLMGVWFGTSEFGTKADMNSKFGALPYDSYVIEEIPTDENAGYTMQKFFFTVDAKSQNGFVDLETITDDIPEIGTQASVDGKNANVTPKKEITLIDTIEYINLKKGETYTAIGKLVDKKTGETIKDAAGKEITSETTFEAKKTKGKVEVTFKFDGSNMYGKDTVVFESVYDAEGRIVAKHEDPEDEGQTVTWEKLKPSYDMYKIRTTKAPSKGDKYGFFAQNEVEYEVHVENTGNIELTMDVADKFTEGANYFTAPKLKGVKFSGKGTWNNKGKDENKANITIYPKETAVVTYTAVVKDEAKEYLAAAAKDSDSLDAKGRDTNYVNQKNKPDDKDGYRNEASCENVTYPNPEKPDEPGKLEPKKDPAQTPVQKPSIGTTLTDEKGNKEVVKSDKTTLVDTVEYKGLDKSKWYVITGTLMVKDTGDPLVENGKEITVTSEPFKPWRANGKQKITFVVNTSGLKGKELVAFETAYRLDGYKKGDDVAKAKKTKVAEHKDLNDKGQTVKIVKPGTPGTPGKGPKTGDSARLAIWIFALVAAAGGMGTIIRRRKKKVE